MSRLEAGARRILVATPFPPTREGMHGGAKELGQFLARLSERNRVALVTLRGPGDLPVDTVIRAQVDGLEEVARVSPATVKDRLARRWRVAAGRFRGMPQWATDWHVPHFEATLRSVVAAWHPDVVQLEYHLMGQYAKALRDFAVPQVLTEPDPGILNARERLGLSRWSTRLLNLLELRAWERFERRVSATVDAIVVQSEEDRTVFAPLSGPTPVVRIPLGVTIPTEPMNPRGVEPPHIVFVGNYMHPPNADAVSRLVHHIFPDVRRRHPTVVLDIVGAGPPLWLRQMQEERVAVSGTVPDVTPYLDRAAIFVAPLRLGGGMRVKMLEALAAGKAVVASRVALVGLNVVDGTHVLVAETDEEFRGALVRLLTHPDMRTALASQARAWARAHLDWARVVESYERLYDELIEKRPVSIN